MRKRVVKRENINFILAFVVMVLLILGLGLLSINSIKNKENQIVLDSVQDSKDVPGIKSKVISPLEKKQLIFIGMDGVQVRAFEQLLGEGRLPNFQRIIDNGGFYSHANVSGHWSTETAPGNAELHTGVGEAINRISNNDVCYFKSDGTPSLTIPIGLTEYERLRSNFENMYIGSVYGKQTEYLPDCILFNGKKSTDLWLNKTNLVTNYSENPNFADSTEVTNRSISDFLEMHMGDNFYLFMYYGVSDQAGHWKGVGSAEYNNSITNMDAGLGILIDWLIKNNMKPQIIISADHGFYFNTHGTRNENETTIPLLSNNATLVGRIYSTSMRRQCDIVPTILDYYGLKPSQYQTITDFGCGSLIDVPYGTPPSISVRPKSQLVSLGQNAIFSVISSGSTPLSYQWYKNNEEIVGANGESYTFTDARSSDNGATFKVNVSNEFGSAMSAPAMLYVFEVMAKDNFVAHFKFDESEGTVAYSSVGSSYGMLKYSPAWTSGKINNALKFESAKNQSVYVPYLKATNNFTISAWINLATVPTTRYYTIASYDDKNAFQIYQQKLIYRGSSAYPATTALTPGRWYHVALTNDNGAMKFYIDGVLDGSVMISGYPGMIIKYLGNDNVNDTFNGMIDDLRIYNRTLNAVEIAGIMIPLSIQYHPADRDNDWDIELDEFTSYNDAFQNGFTWPSGQNPIDINYFTRAINLNKKGTASQGAYQYDLSAISCPMCWIVR